MKYKYQEPEIEIVDVEIEGIACDLGVSGEGDNPTDWDEGWSAIF